MPMIKCKYAKDSHSVYLDKIAKKQGLKHLISTPTKDHYTGQWNLDYKEGFGRMITRTARVYEGAWWKNFRHGYGVSGFVDDSGVIKLEYRIKWKKGRYSGVAEKHYKDGSFFKGFMKNSMREHSGQMWYIDGSFYEGEYHLDMRHGKGLYVYPNSNRYEGFWDLDKKHGYGRYFHLATGQMQEGYWKNDICVTSSMVDIPYKQTSKKPMIYSIKENELVDPDEVIEDELADKSCKDESFAGSEKRLTYSTILNSARSFHFN